MRDIGQDCRWCIRSGIALALVLWLTGVGRAAVENEDPFFGPWYNLAEKLPESRGQANRLPADAGADGVQRWAFVDAWLVSGPYPQLAWTAESPAACPTDFTNVAQKIEFGKVEKPVKPVVTLSDEDEDGETAGFAKDIDSLFSEEKKKASPPWTPINTNAHLGVQWPPTWKWLTRKRKGKDKPKPQVDAGVDNGYYYATTLIHAEKDIEVWAAVGADDRAKVWVNDKLVTMSNPVHAGSRTVTPPARVRQGKVTPGVPTLSSPLTEDLLMFRVKFAKGPNRVVICCANDLGLTYFWMRVCLRGRPLPATTAQAKTKAVAKRIAAPRTIIRGFRNDSRNSYPDAKPVTAWNWDKGINIRWRVPLFLPAKATPIVAGDKVFTLLDPGVLVCLDKHTGKILWERECSRAELIDKDQYEQSKPLFEAYRAARNQVLALSAEERIRPKGKGLNDAAVKAAKAWRSFALTAGKSIRWGWDDWTGHSMGTPVTDGRHVWVKFATGVAACYDLDGNRRWMVPIDSIGHWHVATSPILVGDSTSANGRAWFIIRLPVDLSQGGKKMKYAPDTHVLLALDARTGAVAWRTPPLNEGCNCSSPVGMRLSDGAADMDVVVSQGGVVVRAEDGKVLLPGIPFAHTAESTATVAGDVIFQDGPVVTAYQLMMLDRDTIGAKLLWTRPRAGCAAGLTLHGGRLYGIGGFQGCHHFDIFDARTGFSVVPEGQLGPLSGRNYVPPVGAGEFVIMSSDGVPFSGKRHNAQCMVILVPEGKVVARNEFETRLVGSPVCDGDRMYVRTDSFLSCIALTGEDDLGLDL